MDPRLVLDCRNMVGESPVWSAEEQALYWVDIVGAHIHRLHPASGQHDTWPTPDLPTSIGLRAKGGFIVGLRRRVALWTPGGPFETLAVPEPDRPGNRLNEGTVAPDGSFWVGTMEDNISLHGTPRSIQSGQGLLYRIAPDGVVSKLTEHAFGITNTMIWTDDGGFITADTMSNRLYRFASEGSGLGIGTPFGPDIVRGLPDGSARNQAGTIYNARVGDGSALAMLAPHGALLGYVELPFASPTSCTFGGAGLRTLYITSARFGIDDDGLAANPREGGLLALDCEEPGLPAYRFAG